MVVTGASPLIVLIIIDCIEVDWEKKEIDYVGAGKSCAMSSFFSKLKKSYVFSEYYKDKVDFPLTSIGDVYILKEGWTITDNALDHLTCLVFIDRDKKVTALGHKYVSELAVALYLMKIKNTNNN